MERMIRRFRVRKRAVALQVLVGYGWPTFVQESVVIKPWWIL